VDAKRTAANCKWARPTMSMPAPIWLEAWDSPWTCVRDERPRPLPDTEICSDCPRWQPKPADASAE
jgi:hypothetical protein